MALPQLQRVALALFMLAAPLSLRAQCTATAQRLIGERKFQDARTETQALLKANPANDAALQCMGRAFLDEGKSDQAVDWFEKAVKANDASAQHHLWLGNALGTEAQKASKLRQPFLARRCKTEFEKAVSLDPTLVDARASLVQFYTLAPGFMGGSSEKADEQVREIATLNPFRGHLEAAWIAEQHRDSITDERELLAAVRAEPDSLAGHLQLAGFYALHNRWDDALSAYDKLIAAKPDEMGSHFLYGRAAAISGKQLDRGERELKFWLSNMPPNAPVPTQAGAHHRLGMIYEQRGNIEAARAEYQKAVSINPANEDAKKALARLK